MKTRKEFFQFLGLIFLIGCSRPVTFQFAWISDTHISRSGTAATDLRAVVEDINQKQHIAFVLVSGDISETDTGQNLVLARSILERLKKPYYIIPGNHDSKWSASGGANFKTLWGDDKFTFEYRGFRFIGMPQGPILRMADGHFAPEDLGWLDSLLFHLENKHQPLIFVTHYPPDRSVDNSEAFLSRIASFSVAMILNGHGHRNRLEQFEGIPGAMGRSTLHTREKPAGYTIVRLSPDSAFFFERIPAQHTTTLWGKVEVPRQTNTTPFPGKENPDSPEETLNPDRRVQWTYETGFTVTSSPVLSGDLVFVGDGGGTLHSLSVEDGSLRWRLHVPGPIYATPAVDSDHVIFTSVDSSIYCVDKLHGRLVWKYTSEAPFVCSPVVQDKVVYCGGSDHVFRALDEQTGREIWRYQGIEGFVETRPLLFQDRVVFGAWDGSVYALDRNSGRRLWRWHEGTPGQLYSPAACWPVAAHGKIFIVAPDRYMTAIDIKSGKTIWRTNRFKVRESIGLSEDRERVYARTMRDTVVAVSSRSREFKPIWISDCDYGYDFAPSMLVEQDGVLFFTTKNGFIFAVEAGSGTVLSRFHFGNTLIHTLTPLNRRKVLFSTLHGVVGLLKILR